MYRNRILTFLIISGLLLASRLLRDIVPNISGYIVAGIGLWLLGMVVHWFWKSINRPDNIGTNVRDGFLFSIGLGLTFAIGSILVTFGFCRDAQAGLVVIGGPISGLGLGIIGFPIGCFISWTSRILVEKNIFSPNVNRTKLIAGLGCVLGLILSIMWVITECRNKLGFYLFR